jgi:MoaA/NifB/PqqE/SkfB family radical SAM enzyme
MNKEVIKRISNWRKGIKSNPYSIEISPTLRCNLHCKFCWRYEKEKIDFGKELTKEQYYNLLDEAKNLGVKEVKIIGGGESTFRRDTFDIMRKIKELGMWGYICTNGTLMTKSSIEMLVKHKWDHIKISFHGAEKKTHDMLTEVPGSYDQVIKNITLINEFKRKYRTKVPFLEFGFVMGKLNYKEVPAMFELAAELKVNAVFIEPITVYSGTGKKLKMSSSQEKEFKEIAKSASDFAKNNMIENNLQNFFKNEFNMIKKTNSMQDILITKNKSKDPFLDMPCYEPFYRLGVRADGVICPCGFLDEGSQENFNEKTLEEIWYGKYFEKRRKEMIKKSLSPYCARCCTTLVSNNLNIREQLKNAR